MNTDDIVNQFANTLQNRNARPCILYGEKKSDSSICKEVKVRDVITIISKQLNAIKNADSVGIRRSKPLCLSKQSAIVPVNVTPMEIQSITENKFETQCFLDTQLINLIENAEAIQKDVKNAHCQKIENRDIKIKDVRKCNKNADNTLTIDVENIDIKTCKINALSEENHLNNVLNTHDNKNNSVVASGDDNGEINDFINDKDDFNDSISNDLELPNSPILKIVKPIFKSLPLIYTLEEFDKFESLAAPVLNGIADIEDAKRIINSQLKASDLFVKTHSEIVTTHSEIVTTHSEIVTTHSEIVTTDKEIECSDNSKFINNKPKTQYSFDINSEVIEDEMLFDSDDDIKYSDELPLTCSLETSLCNNTEVLDKTMYVGFQTASNQSIQILSDSFKKAKTVFDNVSKTVAEDLSITELVEAFDRKTSQADDVIKEIDNEMEKESKLITQDDYATEENTIEHKNITKNDNNHITEHIDENIMKEFENNLMFFEDNVSIESTNERKMACSQSSNGIETNYEETNILGNKSIYKNNLKRSYPNLIGFKTASNKKIRISDQALTKTKNIFDDIDLNNSESNFFTTKHADFPKESIKDFVGFKTANNKNIKISAEAVLKTKNIFDNIDNEISSNQKVDNKQQTIKQKSINTEPVIHNFINSISVKNMKKCASFPFKEIDLEKASSIRNSNNNTNDIKHKVANQFQGFNTASNKTVIISDSTLEESKKIFQEIIEDQNTRELEEMKNELHPVKSIKCLSFKGLKTANDKPIKISDDELIKIKTVFQDIETGTLSDDGYVKESSVLQSVKTEYLSKPKCLFQDIKNKDYNKNIAPNQKESVFNPPDFKTICVTKEETPTSDKHIKKPCFAGFQTASNKNVTISEDALIKSRKIFEDIDLNNQIKDSYEKNTIFKGFCTASNKTVHVSEDTLIQSGKIFEDIDLNNKNKKPNVTDAKFKGFCTASNKKVHVSEDALIQSGKIFVDIDLNNKNKKSYETGTNFKGFCTASNKKVHVSEDALIQSGKIFEDIDLNNKNKKSYETGANFKGFCTASNKKVHVSEAALIQSGKIFEDIDLNNKNKKSYETGANFKGFCTASNKKVNISEDALIKSGKIFEDIDLNNKNKKSYETGANFKGFCTASNKKVHVSEDALIQSGKIFEDIDLNNKNKKSYETGANFKGFCTASNKKVNISEDALIKSGKIFEDIDLNNQIKDSYEKNANFKGFCTASNKKVHISEDALIKSGKIFENICDKNEYCEEELKNKIKAKLKNNVTTNIISKKPDIHKSKEIIIHEENKITESVIHVEDFLNTEIIKIFDESLHTEDFFKENTPTCKRSGSPILSCSKTKRKKFETPKSTNKIMQRDIKILKPLNLFKFDENYKKMKKYKLADILAEKSENLIENIDPYISGFKFDTLLEFRFENNRNDIDSDSWTTEKIKKYFTDSVNKKNIPEGWIDNHIKLIIWKLISYEMFSPKHMKYTCSIKNVLQQLKYRYDRELYNVERPALRKILEKDDVSTKLMILCVASLYVDGVSVNSITNQIKNIELLLTDGWYCVKAKGDGMIDKLIIDGKISIGTKLAIHGAELTNCDQGISPWEDTSAVRLKISGNSTKRAKWDARLGFHVNGALMSRLTSVRLEGGKISKLRVFVTRVYPTMYVEKFEDGSTVTRSERLEHLHQMKCETERQMQMEKLYEDVVKMSEQESDDSEEHYTEYGNLDTGSQISRLMKKSKDPLEFKATLTSSQAHMLNEYTDRQNEKFIQKIQNKAQVLIKKRGLDVARNVVPLMKVRVFDEKKAMITIWRPNESLLDLIKEGAWIDVYNVVPTSIRYSEIQISAGRQSMFCKSKFKESDRLRTLTPTLRRKCYTIKNLQSPMTTDYNEIDTCGLVFLIEPKDYEGTKELFQNVYLSGVDKSIISVNFWGGVKKFGFENILEVGEMVACVNLQKRAGNTRSVPQYRATEYTYFTKTPKFVSAKKILDELSAQLLKTDKNKIIRDCIDLRNNYLNLKYSNTENVSPYRMNNSEYNISRNKMFIESPLIDKVLNSNLTNLESELNFKQTRELSTDLLLRKKKVDEKIARLKTYGEPPPLNHIHIINKSSNAIRPYKSPLISNDTSPSVANTNFKSIHNVTSGTISVNKISSPVLNRTYVKINPVKLNFALEENNFAEDLDSPPLSLDLSK